MGQWMPESRRATCSKEKDTAASALGSAGRHRFSSPPAEHSNRESFVRRSHFEDPPMDDGEAASRQGSRFEARKLAHSVASPPINHSTSASAHSSRLCELEVGSIELESSLPTNNSNASSMHSSRLCEPELGSTNRESVLPADLRKCKNTRTRSRIAMSAEQTTEEDMQHKSLEKPSSQSRGRNRTNRSTNSLANYSPPIATNVTDVGSRFASEDRDLACADQPAEQRKTHSRPTTHSSVCGDEEQSGSEMWASPSAMSIWAPAKVLQRSASQTQSGMQ